MNNNKIAKELMMIAKSLTALTPDVNDFIKEYLPKATSKDKARVDNWYEGMYSLHKVKSELDKVAGNTRKLYPRIAYFLDQVLNNRRPPAASPSWELFQKDDVIELYKEYVDISEEEEKYTDAKFEFNSNGKLINKPKISPNDPIMSRFVIKTEYFHQYAHGVTGVNRRLCFFMPKEGHCFATRQEAISSAKQYPLKPYKKKGEKSEYGNLGAEVLDVKIMTLREAIRYRIYWGEGFYTSNIIGI